MKVLAHITRLETPKDLIKCLEEVCPELKGEYKVNEWEVESLYPYSHRFYYDRFHSVLEIKELSIDEKRRFIAWDCMDVVDPNIWPKIPEGLTAKERDKLRKPAYDKHFDMMGVLVKYEKILSDAQR